MLVREFTLRLVTPAELASISEFRRRAAELAIECGLALTDDWRCQLAEPIAPIPYVGFDAA